NQIRLPKMGLSMEEGRIVHWLVSVGEAVAKDTPIAEVETDKAVVELPMPQDGAIEQILVPEGEMVAVGQVIAQLRSEGSGAEPIQEQKKVAHSDPAPRRIAASPSARRRARELNVDWTTLQGTGPGGRIIHRDIEGAVKKVLAEPAVTVFAESLSAMRRT